VIDQRLDLIDLLEGCVEMAMSQRAPQSLQCVLDLLKLRIMGHQAFGVRVLEFGGVI
jgi:hypothetical protein